MSDLPPESARGFEIRPRLNEEMEYFKENALQETEKWIELVTKKRFKYPEDPRRSLQDGILLCELVNALKPGSVRKINRLPTPIAFLDNLTVFQNACRYEFGMQDSQLFDIKDLEDLTLRGVLESEEDIQVETSRRLKNVAITVFWLGKAVRRWYKGPMLDFTAFTDIIDMSHSSQASFRTPSEASFVSSSTGRFSTDRYSSSKASKKQSDMAYERVAKYLESKPAYGYQTSYDYQEPVNKGGSQRGEVFLPPGSDFEEEYCGGSVDSGEMFRPVKVSPKQVVPLPSRGGEIRSHGSTAFPTRTNGTLDISQQLDSSHVIQSKQSSSSYRGEDNLGPRLSDRTSSPESLSDQKGRVRLSLGSPRADGVRSPASPGTGVTLDPLQFVKGGSTALAENAKQTMQMLQQQQQQQGVRQLTMTQEDDNWEAKLSDWKSRRRSQTKSQTTSETDDIATEDGVGVISDEMSKNQEKPPSAVPRPITDHTNEPTSPSGTVIKRRGQEEDMLAAFGFTKIPEKPVRKSKGQGISSEDTAQRETIETNKWRVKQNQEAAEMEAERQRSDEWILEKQSPVQRSDAAGSAATPGFGVCFSKSSAEVASDLGEPKRRYLEKIIKISQRPMHHKGFGFSIRGGKEYGTPITVDKVHLGGAADVCDLMSKDEIVAINGAQLANHYLESVRSVIDQAVHCGQVELTIRRTLSYKSFDESESEAFAEEDLVFDVDQNDDETDSKLLEMLELEKDRPTTPVPPEEDEPPPLPAVPPPAPNWNTFPGLQGAFCPADDFQYFDDAEPSRENLHQEEVVRSKAVPPTAAPRGDVQQRTGSEGSTAKDPEKFDMLMKRIHFFGLKPEDSEEYRKTMEEKNLKQGRSEVQDVPRSSSSSVATASPVVQSDDRMFAVVVSPCEATPSSSAQPTPTSQTISSCDISHQLHSVETSPPSVPFSCLETQDHLEQQEVHAEEREVVGNAENVDTTYGKEEDRKGFVAKSLSPNVDREKFFAEYGKSDLGLKPGNRAFDSGEMAGETGVHVAAESDNRFVLRDQQPSSFKETMHANGTSPNKDTDSAIQLAPLYAKKLTPNEERQNAEVKLREKPTEEVAVDLQLRHSENFSPPFETSKGWKSMEMLRSFSVGDAVLVDPMERAREDYLSLMVSRPKINLERINRQYFDLDSDLKRMEEWHKKQEQLRQEKFDRDQEDIRLKHEAALKEATALEKEKQKQEEQMLEKDLVWKHQLEEIQQQRDKELAVKKQREEREQQALAADRAERERERVREIERERKANALLSFTEDSQKALFKGSGVSPQKVLSSVEKPPADVKIGKVEIQFIDSAPTHANLEFLSDSVNASSESLASSSQLGSYTGEGANGRNMETISERERGAPSSDYSVASKTDRSGHPTVEWTEGPWSEQPDRGAGSASPSNQIVDFSKPVPRDGVLPGMSVQRTRSEQIAETERSAQLIRDEALSISRRAGGGSQWLGPDAEEYLQMAKPEPAIGRSVPANPAPASHPSSYQFPLRPQQQQPQQSVIRRIVPLNPSPEPLNRQSVPLNPSPTSLPSNCAFPQQPQQQPRSRRLLQDFSAPPKHRFQDSESWITARPNDDEDEDVRRSQEIPVPQVAMWAPPSRPCTSSVPPNPSPTSLPSNCTFPQQPQQQQQPWNRKLLQDISAPPKHRLQEGESWINARQNDDEVEAVRRSQEIEHQVPPVAMRASSSGKPSVPVRTDSLKQTSPNSSTPPPQNSGVVFALTSGARQPRSSGSPDVAGDLQGASQWQGAHHPHLSSGSSLENLPPVRWPTTAGSPTSNPDSFNVPALIIEHSKNQSCSNQSRGTLDQLPQHPTGGSDPLVFSRYSEVGSVAGTQPPDVRLRSYELPLRSASYNVPQQGKSRPYSCDLSQYSSPVSAPRAAVPYQRSLRDPTPLEPASEAVSMLFDYHQSPLKDDVARHSLDMSHGLKSLESSSASTTDGGQKCAGCDGELGFGRCIVLDSLDFCFHPGCFKCSVCRCPLRNQSQRDEFRILASRLHCRNCYTNEQEGLKYSKV